MIKDYEFADGENEKLEDATIVVGSIAFSFFIVMFVILLLIFFPSKAHASKTYSTVEIADAIFQAEGGAKAQYLYGIRSVHYKDVGEAQEICLRTIRHAKRDWIHEGRRGDFIDFLQARYCPTNCGKDNQFWSSNVRYFISRKGVK